MKEISQDGSAKAEPEKSPNSLGTKAEYIMAAVAARRPMQIPQGRKTEAKNRATIVTPGGYVLNREGPSDRKVKTLIKNAFQWRDQIEKTQGIADAFFLIGDILGKLSGEIQEKDATIRTLENAINVGEDRANRPQNSGNNDMKIRKLPDRNAALAKAKTDRKVQQYMAENLYEVMDRLIHQLDERDKLQSKYVRTIGIIEEGGSEGRWRLTRHQPSNSNRPK